jgi:hypothetical protein
MHDFYLFVPGLTHHSLSKGSCCRLRSCFLRSLSLDLRSQKTSLFEATRSRGRDVRVTTYFESISQAYRIYTRTEGRERQNHCKESFYYATCYVRNIYKSLNKSEEVGSLEMLNFPSIRRTALHLTTPMSRLWIRLPPLKGLRIPPSRQEVHQS